MTRLAKSMVGLLIFVAHVGTLQDYAAAQSKTKIRYALGDVISIDELPLLALAGCFAEGETVIKDAAELRAKESDRVTVTGRALRAMGADIEDTDEGWRIRGTGRLRGAGGSSRGDHRMAMLLAMAGSVASGETVISNAGAVGVSYPWFWHDLDVLART